MKLQSSDFSALMSAPHGSGPKSAKRLIHGVFGILLLAWLPVDAATLWVSPQSWGNAGSARFEFALPKDMAGFASAKVVLVSGDPVSIDYEAWLQNGALLVDGHATLLENRIRELDISPLMLDLAAQEHASVVFEAIGATPKVLALRFDYRETENRARAAARQAVDPAEALVTSPAFNVQGSALIGTDLQVDGALEVGGAVTLLQDGTGSGIDADLLDGQEGTAFATSAHDHGGTIGALICTNGQVAKYNSGSGVWACGNDIDTDTTYSDGNQLTLAGTTFNVEEGSGSGLDADLLDGVDSAGFAPASAGVRSFATANTAAGSSALPSSSPGTLNTAFGVAALGANNGGNYNTATGGSALSANTTGSENTATGNAALGRNIGGTGNTATGYEALRDNEAGASNTATGNRALANTTASNNTAVGFKALWKNSSAADNTALGASALETNTTGTRNTAVGRSALLKNADTHDNTAIGHEALTNNTAADNTALGSFSLLDNTTGTRNTAVGKYTLWENKTTHDNTAMGHQALVNNTGARNTAVGSNALAANTTANDNTAVGYLALANSTGAQNTAVGKGALDAANNTGDFNSALGDSALSANTSGASNTAVGQAALLSNTTASGNTAVGAGALRDVSTGSGSNTAVGIGALNQITSGQGNVAIGENAGSNLVAGATFNIHIANAGLPTDTFGVMRLGGTTQEKAFIGGIRGATTDVADAVTVLIDSEGQLGTVSSSRRYKEYIRDMDGASDALLALRPVTFRYRSDVQAGERPLEYGLVAEEVAEVFPQLVVYGKDGEPETVKYRLLSTLLLNELQKQEALNRSQSAELETQSALNRALGERLARVESALSTQAASQ